MKTQRFTRPLDKAVAPVNWPAGYTQGQFNPDAASSAVHRLLKEGYAGGGGGVADYQSWWTSLRFDPEFDPGLMFPVCDPRGQMAAVAVCRQSAFVKDLVVAPSHRRRGLASNLLLHIFATFRARGANSVSLKVEADNLRAISLYRSAGMIESAVDD